MNLNPALLPTVRTWKPGQEFVDMYRPFPQAASKYEINFSVIIVLVITDICVCRFSSGWDIQLQEEVNTSS